MPGLPWDDRDSSFGTRIVARLMPQVSTVTAQQDLDRVTRELEEQEGRQLAHPEIKSLTDLYVGDMRKQIWILAGAAGFVLLIAVANVGNLVLARGEDRRREVAVRSALGAGRASVIRTLLAESLTLAASRTLSTLLAVFAILAVTLASVGISGVMAYLVAQRTKEIGIRMALGADARQVVGWIAGRGLVLAGGGVAIGLLAAVALSGVLRTLLYEVSPLDPGLYLVLSLRLLAVAALAAYLPARRATRVDPVNVLNREG